MQQWVRLSFLLLGMADLTGFAQAARDPFSSTTTAVALNAVQYVGMIEQPGKQWALLRENNGAVVSVALHERLGQEQVVSITEQSLTLLRQGKARLLPLVAGG